MSEPDLRPTCDSVTEHTIKFNAGTCTRRAIYKLINRDTDEVVYRCAIHDSIKTGWLRFRLGKNGKALPPR